MKIPSFAASNHCGSGCVLTDPEVGWYGPAACPAWGSARVVAATIATPSQRIHRRRLRARDALALSPGISVFASRGCAARRLVVEQGELLLEGVLTHDRRV